MACTVLSVATRAVLAACSNLGIDTQQLLESVGLSAAAVADTDARIPADKADALWRHAYALADDAFLALHAAEALPFGAYKVLDFIVGNAATIGQGLTRVLHYFPLIDARASLEVRAEHDTFCISMESTQGTVPGPAQEYTLAALLLRSRASTQLAWPVERVGFAMDPPVQSSEHERIFGCEVRFAQRRAQMVVSSAVWNTPVHGANSALFGVLEDHAQRLLKELPVAQPPSLVDRVRAVLREELRGGDVSAVHVAKRLGLGERTLQRRLMDVESSYVELLSAERHVVACEYLRESGISLTEVAFMLGFAEQSSFARAFKRWTGKPPGLWRSEMQGEA